MSSPPNTKRTNQGVTNSGNISITKNQSNSVSQSNSVQVARDKGSATSGHREQNQISTPNNSREVRPNQGSVQRVGVLQPGVSNKIMRDSVNGPPVGASGHQGGQSLSYYYQGGPHRLPERGEAVSVVEEHKNQRFPFNQSDELQKRRRIDLPNGNVIHPNNTHTPNSRLDINVQGNNNTGSTNNHTDNRTNAASDGQDTSSSLPGTRRGSSIVNQVAAIPGKGIRTTGQLSNPPKLATLAPRNTHASIVNTRKEHGQKNSNSRSPRLPIVNDSNRAYRVIPKKKPEALRIKQPLPSIEAILARNMPKPIPPPPDLMEIAEKLDFEVRPRPARDGGGGTISISTKNGLKITSDMKYLMMLYAIDMGYSISEQNTPVAMNRAKRSAGVDITTAPVRHAPTSMTSFTRKNKKRIHEAACRIVCYDYGLLKPIGSTTLQKAFETFRRQKYSTTVNLFETRHQDRGRKSYIQKIEELNPGYLRTLFIYAKERSDEYTKYNDYRKIMVERSKKLKPDLDFKLTMNDLMQFFDKNPKLRPRGMPKRKRPISESNDDPHDGANNRGDIGTMQEDRNIDDPGVHNNRTVIGTDIMNQNGASAGHNINGRNTAGYGHFNVGASGGDLNGAFSQQIGNGNVIHPQTFNGIMNTNTNMNQHGTVMQNQNAVAINMYGGNMANNVLTTNIDTNRNSGPPGGSDSNARNDNGHRTAATENTHLGTAL